MSLSANVIGCIIAASDLNIAWRLVSRWTCKLISVVRRGDPAMSRFECRVWILEQCGIPNRFKYIRNQEGNVVLMEALPGHEDFGAFETVGATIDWVDTYYLCTDSRLRDAIRDDAESGMSSERQKRAYNIPLKGYENSPDLYDALSTTKTMSQYNKLCSSSYFIKRIGEFAKAAQLSERYGLYCGIIAVIYHDVPVLYNTFNKYISWSDWTIYTTSSWTYELFEHWEKHIVWSRFFTNSVHQCRKKHSSHKFMEKMLTRFGTPENQMATWEHYTISSSIYALNDDFVRDNIDKFSPNWIYENASMPIVTEYIERLRLHDFGDQVCYNNGLTLKFIDKFAEEFSDEFDFLCIIEKDDLPLVEKYQGRFSVDYIIESDMEVPDWFWDVGDMRKMVGDNIIYNMYTKTADQEETWQAALRNRRNAYHILHNVSPQFLEDNAGAISRNWRLYAKQYKLDLPTLKRLWKWLAPHAKLVWRNPNLGKAFVPVV